MSIRRVWTNLKIESYVFMPLRQPPFLDSKLSTCGNTLDESRERTAQPLKQFLRPTVFLSPIDNQGLKQYDCCVFVVKRARDFAVALSPLKLPLLKPDS